MRATVHHNSRHAASTVSDDQTGLKPYEIRVYIHVPNAVLGVSQAGGERH